MLHNKISPFLQYCKNSNFSKRSLETLEFRLNEFNTFIQQQAVPTIEQIEYHHLVQFVADYGTPSPSVKKVRVWSLNRFFHYLKLQQLIPQNVAAPLPYPKIEKKIAKFLTDDEFKRILHYFFQHSNDRLGLRNLVMIMLMGFLGLRTSAIVAINIRDVDLIESRLWIHEKGYWGQTKKVLPLPQVLCHVLVHYINQLDQNQEPLFISKRNQRYSPRSLQTLFKNVAGQLGIDKQLHPHLFRHTTATQINQVAGLQITQFLLGHQRMANTDHYAHLNPDSYAEHMKQHPYMTFDL
ncbi:tyrosine-type recombinase/integrase [candidate division KSB1 bacterium]|nr:tyrosine-type recombinase/integrase [candidate division KSB1 bacterium]